MPYLWTLVAKVRGRRFDNANVRTWQAGLTGLPARAHAAHLNSFEAFPLFAVAVIVAQFNEGDPGRVDALAMAFVGLRFMYGVLYLADKPTLRSVVWLAALVCVLAIFFSGQWCDRIARRLWSTFSGVASRSA
jgi:uncharacterized MAPEG superfamily protein